MRVKRYKFWKQVKKEMSDATAVLDITHGDSFSDIYGKEWFIQTNLVKTFMVYSKVPFILMPQTYGPFSTTWAKKWAKHVIKKAAKVYTRDMMSYEYLTSLGVSKNLVNTLDLAFALPYKADKQQSKKIKIGINVSGLLWDDCVAQKNNFGLTADYCKYCRKIIDYLLGEESYEVHLIPHVLCDFREGKEFFENDSKAIRILMDEFPNCIFPNDFKTALDVKNYIANMDLLIAARMHASIAAYSSGVPVIPFAYSRKFEGVYNDLKYPYIINGRELSTEEAVLKTINYITIKDKLIELEIPGRNKLSELQSMFLDDFSKTLKKVRGNSNCH